MDATESAFMPDGDIRDFQLSEIIDCAAIQSLMDDFFAVTNIGVAVVDLSGEVLVATGWQDICTRFHRVHPETRRYCLESDLELSRGIEPGTFKRYRCKNGMWDMSTPITAGGRHVGNLYLGQFLFEDEVPDDDLFRRQASRYGFDEHEYLEALHRVPRWSRQTVDAVMTFYAKLTLLISSLGHSRLALAQALADSRRMAADLQESESRLQAITGSAHDAIVLIDSAGNICRWNRAAELIYGYSADEILGESSGILVEESLREEYSRAMRVLLETGEAPLTRGKPAEIPSVRKDGSGFVAEATTARFQIGDRWYVVAVIRDITERRAVEEALRVANVELAGYAHVVSHDLKGPIASTFAALTLLESIVKDIRLPEEAGEQVAELLHVGQMSMNRASELVEDLLALAGEGKPQEVIPVSIDDTVGEVLSENESVIEQKGITVEVDRPLGSVIANPTHMYQLFSNLIRNSIEHSRSESLLIEVRKLADTGTAHRFLIRDNGQGIPDDIIGDLFTPFVKAQSTGTGLGMSLVEKIVKACNGRIRVYNDSGACFEFTLKDCGRRQGMTA